MVLLTNAIQSISIQLVSHITAAEEAANGVIAALFTSSICSLTFINVYGAREHTMTTLSVDLKINQASTVQLVNHARLN